MFGIRFAKGFDIHGEPSFSVWRSVSGICLVFPGVITAKTPRSSELVPFGGHSVGGDLKRESDPHLMPANKVDVFHHYVRLFPINSEVGCMSDISVLEGRLQAALDRIGRALEDVQGVSQSESEPDESLILQLEENKARIAELESIVAERASEPEQQVTELRAMLEEAAAEKQQIQSAVMALRGRIRGLRAANKQNVGDPALINASLQAELDAMTMLRDSDRAELDGILAELEPLMKGANDA